MSQAVWDNEAKEGREALEEGRLEAAEVHLKDALIAMQERFGYQDPALAEVVENLAKLYCGQRMYGRGRAFYRRLIGIKEQELGSDHADVQSIRTNLGMLRGAADRLMDDPSVADKPNSAV